MKMNFMQWIKKIGSREQRQRLAHMLKPVSIRRQILSLSVLNGLALLLCSGIGYAICVHAYNRHLYSATADGLYSTSAMISEQIKAVESLSSALLSSPEIQNSLVRIYQTTIPAEQNDYNQIILDQLQNSYSSLRSAGVAYLAIYNDRFTTCTNWAHLNHTGDALLNSARQAAKSAQGKVVWTYSGRDDFLLLSRDIRQIENLSLKPLGTLVIAVDLDQTISQSTRRVTQMDACYMITDRENRLIYASPALSDRAANYFLSHTDNPYQLVRLDGHDYFTVIGSLPEYDFCCISIAPYDSVTHSLMLMRFMVAASVVLGFLAVFTFTKRLMRRLSVQLGSLTQQMRLFGDTELSMDVFNRSIPYYDELETIYDQFRLMAEQIHTLVKVNYTNEILTRDAQLKALKTQINPHFLYNTLQTVNWRAKATGDTQTSQIIESLGTLLRASLSNERSLVRLSEELTLVDCYITIQRIRFEDRLDFKADVDPPLRDAIIPPLTIQPLVENAIHYGMESMTDTCHVFLTAASREKELTILVKNEGSSFEEGLLEKLRDNQIKPGGFGIGLMNIDQRIRLMYGDSFGLQVYNEGDYAVAQITLPFYTEEEQTKQEV